MQKQVKLAFTGYKKSNVKLALSTIKKQSSNFNVTINSESIPQSNDIGDQPKLWGCTKEDVIRYSVLVSGSLKDVKDLVKSKTPDGVQIELLPSSV